MQCRGSIRNPGSELRLAVFGELVLEGRNLGAEDVATAIQDILDRTHEFDFDQRGFSRQSGVRHGVGCHN